jgi:L-malate glycosyltransferase
MKIAFVYDAIYPYVKGGVEKRVWELAVRLSRHGHDVHLFGMKFWDGGNILIRDGVSIHGVCPAQKLYVSGRRSITQPLHFSIGLIHPLLREKFDIIDCQAFPYFSCFSAKLLSKLKKIPLIITWHEVWGNYWHEYLGWKGFAGKCIERLVAGLTPDNIAVSKTTANNLEILGISTGVKIIPNGVDLKKIQSVSPSDSCSDIIFAGRLIREKHVDILILAFREILLTCPALKLLIIGEGPEYDSIKNQIIEHSLENQVQLTGFQENYDNIIALMKSSKICVLPSTREGFGITALEALASGLPVVTIDHPANATRDLITERNGFLCLLSSEDLATSMFRALHAHGEMREDCIKSAQAFDWDCVTQEIESYYLSIVDDRRAK